MKLSTKISLAELHNYAPDKIDLFIGCASFEKRSQSLARAITPNRVGHAVFCVNEDYAESASKNIEALKNLYPSKHEILNIRTDAPLLAADHFSETLAAAPIISGGTIFVDITTFTHEQLLILIRILRNSVHRFKIIAGYTGASQYATDLPDEQKWLSKGVDDIRSVLGYPGNLLPSRKLHLVVLAGFESERAEKVIEAYDPAIISLGIGEQSASISKEHHATNAVFHRKLLELVEKKATVIAKVEQFQFSCIDPLDTRRTILEQAKKFPGHNTVIAPMNTKISTLGTALAAFEEESLQVCYAHPKAYNTHTYSLPGSDCRLFDLTDELDAMTSPAEL
ncbi:MAG: hypothetical protein RI101_06765 [Nitrospira sp.]|nr:hypothetical protein [Nitrospira sp.]